MEAGDKVRRFVYALGKVLEGTVTWIHPAGRYFVVRFTLPGGTFRESYKV